MLDPKPEDVGKRVIYRPHMGKQESGVITSYNERFVFVRYDKQASDAPGQATPREYLYWEHQGTVGVRK